MHVNNLIWKSHTYKLEVQIVKEKRMHSMKTVEIEVRDYDSKVKALQYPCNESCFNWSFFESEEGIADYFINGFLLQKAHNAV